jgi:hypothetical protein
MHGGRMRDRHERGEQLGAGGIAHGQLDPLPLTALASCCQGWL